MNQSAERGVTALSVVPQPRPDIARGRGAVEASFQVLPPRLFAAGACLTQARGETILRLRRGWAIRPHDWPDGRRAIVDIQLPGDIIGIDAAFGRGPADPVIAVTPVTAQAIEGAEAVAALLANRYALLYLAGVAAEERRRADRLAAAIARLDAARRLAAMLLDFSRRLYGDGDGDGERSYHLPLTQQQIGDHLGLTVVHVNRVLRQLRRQRLIELDRHVVVLRDAAQLERLVAGEAQTDLPAAPLVRSAGRAPPRIGLGAPVAAPAG